MGTKKTTKKIKAEISRVKKKLVHLEEKLKTIEFNEIRIGFKF
ncbi:MAG: hypothetical protein ACUZ8E_06965 [Candidatus Anammoxibacter sp.]